MSELQVWMHDMQLGLGADTNDECTSINYFFEGCNKFPKCVNCHNPGMWNRKENSKISLHIVEMSMEMYKDNADAVVFVGGEPLDQPKAVYLLARKAKELGLATWLYTGNTYSNIPTNIKDIMDVIVSGEYREELKTGGFPGSSNQVVTRRK